MSIEMNASIAKTLIKNYTDHHLAVINSNAELTALRQPDSTSDARCSWSSIDELQSFIDKIKTTTAEKCYAMHGALGIRTYYCEYPAANSPLWGTPGLPVGAPLFLERYAGMHNIMLVPTYNNGENNVDFDPDYATEAGMPMPITAVFAGATPTTNVMMMDHGSMVPPPYPTSGIYGPTTGAYMLDIANS